MTDKNEIKIIQATSDDEIDAVKSLFMEHEKELNEAACFQDFETEMSDLQKKYAPPAGALLLAYCNGQAVGVVGMIGSDEVTGNKIAEMKRLYVQPKWRGRGIGRILCEQIMARARDAANIIMSLETLSRLEAAVALYREYGFIIEDENIDKNNGEPKRDKNILVMVASL